MSKIRAMQPAEALDFLARAPVMTLACVDDEGLPLLRTLHGLVLDGALWFHGGARGEKAALVGRPVLVAAEEAVARIPSWMRDPERACPATTFYRSVHARGVLELVEDPGEKARMLQAFMQRFQPEGGHVPITAEHPLYAAAVRGIRVLRLVPTTLTGRVKLGTHLGPREREAVVRGLWKRGEPGDLAAMEAILEANPGTPSPFVTPPGLRACVTPGAAQATEAAAMLADAYWNEGQSAEQLRQAHLHSTAWVVLQDEAGALVATARAISDRAKRAWVYDVCVHPTRRGEGLGRALLDILLDHPALRGAELNLGTRDAQRFYAPMGFRDRADLPPRPYRSTWMVRPRPEL